MIGLEFDRVDRDLEVRVGQASDGGIQLQALEPLDGSTQLTQVGDVRCGDLVEDFDPRLVSDFLEPPANQGHALICHAPPPCKARDSYLPVAASDASASPGSGSRRQDPRGEVDAPPPLYSGAVHTAYSKRGCGW